MRENIKLSCHFEGAERVKNLRKPPKKALALPGIS